MISTLDYKLLKALRDLIKKSTIELGIDVKKERK